MPDLNEAVILTPTVINLLSEVAKYNVLSVGKAEPDTSNQPEDNADPQQQVAAINETRELEDDSLDTDSPNFLNTEKPEGSHNERVADRDTLAKNSMTALRSYRFGDWLIRIEATFSWRISGYMTAIRLWATQ